MAISRVLSRFAAGSRNRNRLSHRLEEYSTTTATAGLGIPNSSGQPLPTDFHEIIVMY
jgi:hypothetical protein